MTRRIVVGSAVGIAFYVVLRYLIGFPETLSYPEWFIQHATEDLLVSEFLSSLAFFTLPIVLISAVFGLLLAKVISDTYFLTGCLAVGVAVLFGVVQVTPDYGVLRAIQISTMPANWIDIPAYLAFYLTLPTACSVSRGRIDVG